MEKKRPDAEAILSAARRIEPYVLRTPVLTSAAIDKSVGGSVFFKCENLQSIGAFKVRGATNAVLSCTDAELRYGVATHSSGNHAQAVARAAKSAGVPAYIVMPASTQKIKQKGVLFYDGKIVECDTSIESREKTLAKVAHDTGAHIVHPYNDYDVIAGQATAAKELTDEVKNWTTCWSLSEGADCSAARCSVYTISHRTQRSSGVNRRGPTTHIVR